MTTGCKIYSREHAEALHRAQTARALELGKYNHLRETYVLGVYE